MCRRGVTHWGLFINGLDDELLIVEGNVSDLAPGEANLRGESEEGSTRTRTSHTVDCEG